MLWAGPVIRAANYRSIGPMWAGALPRLEQRKDQAARRFAFASISARTCEAGTGLLNRKP